MYFKITIFTKQLSKCPALTAALVQTRVDRHVELLIMAVVLTGDARCLFSVV